MKFDNIREAAEYWVNGFNAIPENIVMKLVEHGENIEEITPPAIGDTVYFNTENEYMSGDVVRRDGDQLVVYCDDGIERVIDESEVDDVTRDDYLPMWGTMWAFGDSIDDEFFFGSYLGDHLREMADCGFRIYEQEDYGYIFGIDGCGYDFFEAHWIPLYNARGLKWHE